MHGSITAITPTSGYKIIFDGKEAVRRTPHTFLNLLPGVHTISVYGDKYYSDEEKIDLQINEDYIFDPKLLPYGELVILSKIKELDFMLKDPETGEKIKIGDERFTYTPYPKYDEDKCDRIYLRKGKYIIEPIDEYLPEIEIEIKNDELNITNYDKLIKKPRIIALIIPPIMMRTNTEITFLRVSVYLSSRTPT